jgi:hypothetical protein
MKTATVSFALALFVCALPAHAQRFEGVITMRVSGGLQGLAMSAARGGSGAAESRAGRGARGGDARAGRGGVGRGGDSTANGARGGGRGGAPAQLEYMTRRGKVRVSFGSGSAAAFGAMIFVPEEGMIYTLIPAASMYSETSLASLNAADTMPMPATRRAALAAAPVVVHTKKFELIADHRCEHVLVTIAKQQTDICIAKGLGTFVMPTGMGRLEAWQKALNDANGFPLKVVQPDGTVAMEVTKVERKMLPESLFTIPDSYSKMPDRSSMRPPPGD